MRRDIASAALRGAIALLPLMSVACSAKPRRQQPLVLRGHTAALSAVHFNADGSKIVTASKDGTARIWNARTGKLDQLFAQHTGAIATAELSSDGRRLVTASADETAKVWDVRTGKLLLSLAEAEAGFANSLSSAHFSQDGRLIVTAGDDGVARTWDALTGKRLIRFRHGRPLLTAEVSRDSKWLATGSVRDGNAKLWNVETGALVAELEHEAGLKRYLHTVAFSPDGNTLLTAGRESYARVWDRASGSAKHRLEHASRVMAAAFSEDGSRIVTASFDEFANLWATQTGFRLAHIRHPAEVYSAAFDRSGTRILTTTAYSAYVWDAKTARLIAAFPARSYSLVSAELSPDGSRVVTANVDGVAEVWSVK
jgi:WD40 repeat protein